MMVLSFTTPAHIEELHPLQNLDVGVRLRNKGRRDTFSVRATFSTYVDYLTANISPEVLEVDHNAHAEIHILVSVHKSISQRIDPRLTVEVTRMSDNSSTSLSRFIKATPTSFGEDAEPPSCVLFYEFSQCDDQHTDEDCADSVWEAAVSVKDISGVYRATFANPSSRLISSIAYKQVHGRLKAEARLRRDCCTLNASLLVEDYMGNQQVCTLNATDMPLDPKGRAPGSKPKRGRQKHGKKHGKSKTTPYEIEEVSLEPITGTSIESDVYVVTTQRTEGKTENERQDDQTDFWSPQLKEKVKIGAIIFGFACFLLIAYCVVYLHSQTVKNTENPSEGKIRTPAFYFPSRRSNRGGAANTGKTNPGQLEMENLGQPTSGFPKNKAQEIETAFSSEGQQSSIVKADPKNATIPSVDGNTLDEAYSSLCFCTTADISKPASQKATSEIADISHIEPKNKTDIYERILQFRDLLEQLEKKRATLVSSLNFKHHTVPRVKQDLWQPDVDWDSENDGFDDDVDNDDDNDDDDDIDNKDITNNIELKNLNESNKNPDGSFENPAFLATESDLEIPNILGESPERDIGQGYLSPQCRKRHQKSKLPVTKDHDCDDIWHDHVTRNSVTPPELSQGHMCMMIEGATQISLRHEIRKLKERLLQCSREVEDALRYERDFCDTLSNDEEEQEDSEFEQM
ncbi:hypothetical protein EGW08_012468 [Elysia chlorotica]|uniref:Uncharacterized protein n=1 Tax=Elysia chlorotica TaxID=188477 RepID=A0A433TDT3_ELYCH|nr:hypothetical protein EGW08_012468 [Elysia chlorotica]